MGVVGHDFDMSTFFTHPFTSFVNSRYYPSYALTYTSGVTPIKYFWEGGSLRYYGEPYAYLNGGFGGHPEASGSYTLAFTHSLCELFLDDPASPTITEGTTEITPPNDALQNPYWSGHLLATRLTSAFFPSGLEFWKIPTLSWSNRAGTYARGGIPIYCVYYSGTPITNFSGWHLRS
jgi:hypothetical protein